MKTRRGPVPISLQNAVRLRSAELWLQLGQPMQALSELQRLPIRIRKHPKAMRVCRSVYNAALS
ncbi:MAG TPA: hypothetical protein VN873_08595 [Candidatus Angelobacter sp.]|nr:hypothetical protein [Candidatus Angelobacter sp.]